jgi:phospholipid transport system substrate-binding protein
MPVVGLALATIAFAVALLAPPASAGPATDQLRERVDRVIGVLSDPKLQGKTEARRAAVRKISEEIFDYEDTARRTLGRHWAERSPQERREFVGLFADLLDQAYFSRIDQYQGEQVRYTGESITGNQAVVKTLIVTNRGSEVPVEYRMHLADGRWRVYDVLIEGVSLVANYRTQFNRVVQTESYQALVDRLRTRQAAPAVSPR